METSLSGFTFFSNFDSGNLHKVEVDEKDTEDDEGEGESSPRRERKRSSPSRRRKSASRVKLKKDFGQSNTPPLSSTDHAFKIWTRPDCAGTEFENGNRTWFFFAIRGSSPQANFGSGKVLKLTVMNLNKQSKVFTQGMTPIMLSVAQNGQLPSYHSLPNGGWERIKERPTYYTPSSNEEGGGNFIMSFRVLYEPHTTLYLAFTYPYTYKDLQAFLGRMDKKYGGLAEKPVEALDKLSPTTIYYHRENVCYSLQKRRIDLLTITSVNGALPEREERLDKLFPDFDESGQTGKTVLRPHKFPPAKKTVFVSARVHPGETQSSFVMNGFLRFLLRESDPRSMSLRKKYVFKLIPMLNPDGVVNGHYRTDLRGVNLNRVYARPNFELHPQIFAARKLLLYAHLRKEIPEEHEELEKLSKKKSEQLSTQVLSKSDNDNLTDSSNPLLSFKGFKPISKPEPDLFAGSSFSDDSSFSSKTGQSITGSFPTPTKSLITNISQLGYEMTETSRCSEGDESIADFSERHGIGVTPSPQRNLFPHLPVGPISFAAAFAQSGAKPVLSGFSAHARRRRLSFGRDEFSNTKRPVGGDNFLEPRSDFDENHSDDLEDDNKNVVGAPTIEEPDHPSLVAQEENANLDFVGKFVRPLSTSFIVPFHDYKPKSEAENKDEEAVENREGSPAQELLEPGSSKREAPPWDPKTSGLFLYVDIHGHASKRGIFMYGNYFNDVETQASCMMLPKLMSINCANFDFPACNFTERNMYLKDRHTGAGREGSGRVSVYKSTGLIHSYTLECNFNTGRVVNGIPMASRDAGRATPPPPPHPLPQTHPGTGTTPNTTLQDQIPPKYTPEIYEDSGKALATSILDLTESNPWTRLTCSACKNLRGVREWLRKYIRAAKAAEADANAERENRGRSGRRKSTNSESSVKSGQVKMTPNKQDSTSPSRSLRSSNRRHRAISASASVIKLNKKSPISPGSYQPLSKITRKSLTQSTSSAARALDLATEPSPLLTQKWASPAKVALVAPSTSKSGIVTPKKRPRCTKKKSLSRNRSISIGKPKSTQSSRPTSPQRRSRPSSPASPSSPTSPIFVRRSVSIGGSKRPRSRPTSPLSRSAGPSSPRPSRSNSAASQGSSKRLTPRKLKKKLTKVRRGSQSAPKTILTDPTIGDAMLKQVEGACALGSDREEIGTVQEQSSGSPKSTPKKKPKVQAKKKSKKTKARHQRAKIIISSASGFNPTGF